MKRIYIALSLVLAALCFASVETGFISGKTDSFIAEIECADRLMSRLEFDDALKICKETEEEWYDSAKFIDTLLIHDYVDAIGISISRMTAFAQKQNRDMYFAESVQAKKELASIKESEVPLVENILEFLHRIILFNFGIDKFNQPEYKKNSCIDYYYACACRCVTEI